MIEWPQYIENILPLEHMKIHIKKNEDETRTLSFHAIGEKYKNVVREIGLC